MPRVTRKIIIEALIRALSQPPAQAGMRLRAERELATVFRVSRPTLRGALAALEEQGILIQQQGSGTYLRRVPMANGGHGAAPNFPVPSADQLFAPEEMTESSAAVERRSRLKLQLWTHLHRYTPSLRLQLESFAEIYDNTPRSYLPANSNYDHFLMLKLFKDLAEMSAALGRKKESAKWKRHAKSLGAPALACIQSPDGLIRGEVLCIAPGMPLDRSHRHHAHLMGVYPLNLLHPSSGSKESQVISDSLHQIDLLGTGEWVGYSFSWYAGLCARIGNGGAAISMLERYLDGFVSPNGFHLNGDFKNLGYSVYKYRPFTLEGNFAAVQAVNEMLLQTIHGIIHVGYALPKGLAASFERLRTEGGFLVSADIPEGGAPGCLTIHSTVGGRCRLANPWPGRSITIKPSRTVKKNGATFEFETEAGADYRIEPR